MKIKIICKSCGEVIASDRVETWANPTSSVPDKIIKGGFCNDCCGVK